MTANPSELSNQVDDLAFRVEHVGSILLADAVDPDTLPIRLREDFAYRPWPTHNLRTRLVDLEFIPSVPEVPDEDVWTIEFIGNQMIRVDGIENIVSESPLELLNLALLSRHWKMRNDEFLALGFASYITDQDKRTNFANTTRKALNQKVAPRALFEKSGSSHDGLYRLPPGLRVVDLRGS